MFFFWGGGGGGGSSLGLYENFNRLAVSLIQYFNEGEYCFYFIPSSEFNAYLKQIKVILSTVKKYRIFSLVMNTFYIFSPQQPEAILIIYGLISSCKDLECTVHV